MKDLDISIGQDLMERLCDDCRERLNEKLTKSDIAMALFPRGLKKLYNKIGQNTCPECAGKIWEEGLKRR